ncbi:DUF1963 domain-containing protein [Deminuibacter soli]|nr:DUF1963 domain-containing protein [Deminuibacter soli]
MNIGEIKQQLAKKTVEFRTGGFKPGDAATESWIGNVYLYKEAEEIPLNSEGDVMYPLLQLHVASLPYIPEALKNTAVITVFVGYDEPIDSHTPQGDGWVLREYTAADQLVVKRWVHPEPLFKTYPLKPGNAEDDFPVWDDPAFPSAIITAIETLEEKEEISNYYDAVNLHYHHKLGGYPSFQQAHNGFDEGFEFMFQIAPDDKAGWPIEDDNNLYFTKNAQTGEWKVYAEYD